MRISPESGLQIKCQVTDYRFRGEELTDYCVLDFFIDTYEEHMCKGKHKESSTAERNQTARGRKSNKRSPYLIGHPRHSTHNRVIRSRGHNNLPDITGQWFPDEKDEEIHEFYCASMLMLLHPWRSITDLKPSDKSWKSAYDEFIQEASPRILRVISNIQYYHECETAASVQLSNDNAKPYPNQELASTTDEYEPEDEDIPQVTVEPITRNDLYTGEAIHIGRHLKMLISPDVSWCGRLQDTYPALLHNIQNLYRWKQQLNGASTSESGASNSLPTSSSTQHTSEHGGYILPEDVYNLHAFTSEEEIAEEALTAVDPSCLLPEQRRAYDIVTWHLTALLQGREPPQLLMQIQGEGGTGKSKVIQTITEFFTHKGSSALLVKSAYTGIAASLINGRTTHNIAKISLSRNKGIANETKAWLTCFWKDVQYLILDECSMISREFFAILEEHISVAKGFVQNDRADTPFGGVNVILCGDFHQFPPVACKKNAPLYYPVHPGKDTIREEMGRKLYEQFKTVVILQTQVRVTDPTWRDFLRHLRTGHVKDTHLPILNALCLMNAACPPTDFTKPPWNEAVLITPRHSVRQKWNSEMLKKHCHDKGLSLFICPSKDTTNGRTLSEAEKSAVHNRKGKGSSRGDVNGLPGFIEIAVGMKVMVTANVDTDIDIANGSRGEITAVILDPQEEFTEGVQNVIHLRYLPMYILVKMSRTRAIQLDGLDPGVVPILPAKRKITIKVRETSGNTVQRTITRIQFPITPAYAFTDYRSQGQTLPYVIVDLARPPSGQPLTNFNYYVALSRSSGRDTIRLLRELDMKLLQQPQDRCLEHEDERLKEWNTETKEWWDAMSSSDSVER